MRKRSILAAVAATTMLALLPMTIAVAAPAATHDVLTLGKVGGTNVKVGAILVANLKTGTKATFFTSGSKGITCKTSTFTDKVTKNPAKPGTATESLTAQKFGKCSVSGISGATGVKSVKVLKLPYKTTISDAKGLPVTVSKAGTKVSTDLTLNTTLGALSCTYSATATKGSASNTGQVISFTKQTFKLSSGPNACPKTGSFTAIFGPVLDTSVKNHPHVFVN